MSLGGVLDNKKHGGAHGVKHEPLTDACLPLTERFLVTETLSENENNVCDGERNQDGDQKLHDNDENGLGENLPFLPELGTDCLDSYDSAVVENNTEWLKARCKNFGQVEFDITPQTTGDDTLDFPGISIDSKVILQNCESYEPNSHTVSNAGVASVNKKISESKMGIQGNGYATPYLSLQSAQIPDGDIGGSSVTLPSSMDASLEHVIMSAVGGTNVADVTGSSGESSSFADLNILQQSKLFVKDGILSVMPDTQIVSSNEGICISSDNGDQTSTGSSQENCTLSPVQQETLTLDASNVQNVASSQNLTENLALTTISIATDKLSNLTKILVNTSQGQQMYHLNIADLTKAQNGGAVAKEYEKPTGVVAQQVQTPTISNQNVLLLPIQDGENNSMFFTQPKEKTVSPPVRDNKVKQEAMFLCGEENCGKMFKTLPKLQVHSMTHTGERPFKCSEPGCDWAFTKSYKLKRHEESHKGNKDFVCSYCHKKFTTIYNLKTHIKQHSRPCTEQCPVEECGLKFQTRRELDRHMKTHEGIEKTYKCPYEGCNKVFLSPHCLGSHPRVHQAEPQDLTCQYEGCGRKFDKLCRLKQHQRTHTGERPYVCHFTGCNWAFSTASKLTRHMTKHTNKRKWICNECGKAFLRAEHLKGHMITHTGIKPFTCPVEGCGQKFVSKSSVYVHLKKHEKAKHLKLLEDSNVTYHCPMDSCDKKYNTKAKLRQHILKHFPGTMKPEDAAHIDIVPLFKNQSQEARKETVVMPSTVSVKTTQDGTIMNIDPLEFMATSIDSKDGSPVTVTNQFTAELTAELTSVAVNSAIPLKNEPEKSILRNNAKKENNDRMGSARTDYHSNKLLSDRAKKRRKLLREKAEGSSVSDDMSDQQHDAMTLDSSSSNLSSHGITFRDPETGVLYVQMQLLQDDPPHPDLYSDESVLNGHLDMSHDSSSAGIDEQDQSSSEFVGSTINLQDLVG